MVTHSEVPGRGRIELICGCMFSGKSELLLARLAEARGRGLRVAVLKHASDDRYGTREIVSHAGRRAPAEPTSNARDILQAGAGYQVVIIDEAQFFDAGIVDACVALRSRGCAVIVAGLDRDSWGLPFGPMPALTAVADELIGTASSCARCGGEATFTQRIAPVAGTCMVGGAESYEPRCERCFEPPPMELRC